MLLINGTVRGLMPRVGITPIYYGDDKNNHNTLKKCQGKITKNNDNFMEPSIVPVRSTVAVQHENSGPCTHGTIIG